MQRPDPAKVAEVAALTALERPDVAIVGAGPVGLTLAMDLQSRGVTVVIACRRSSSPRSINLAA